MHQNSFGGRAPPGPAGGAYSAPPDPLAEFRGAASRQGGERGVGEGKDWGEGGEGGGEGKEGGGRREGEGKGYGG